MDINAIAERIYNIDIYEARNNDISPADIVKSIQEDPLTTINYLLDLIDELQA